MSEKICSGPSRTVTGVAVDKAHLRSLVYELARVGLQNDLHRQYELELKKQSTALEQAIAQIESHFSPEGPEGTPALPPLDARRIIQSTQIAVVPSNGALGDVYSVETQPQFEVLSPVRERSYSDRRWVLADGHVHDEAEAVQRAQGWVWWRFQIAVAVIAGLVIYAAGEWSANVHGLISHETHSGSAVSKGQGSSPAADRVAQTIDGAPLPTAYGIYAIDHGKLTDLQPLLINAPDPRIAISAIISSPSQTTLPDGHVEFVVFRRDLLNDAPDRASVRVVARVMHALTFSANKQAKYITVNGAWAVRSNAYEMKVAPVSGHPEMIRISPADAETPLPAGRYALVFKKLAYDFNVAGPITDLKQCLERTDALDVAVYAECRRL